MYEYACERCGKYYVSHCDYDDYLDSDDKRRKQEPHKLSALCREQQIQRLPPLFLQFTDGRYPTIPETYPKYVAELLDSDWPRTVSDRLRRALCNLARLSDGVGRSFSAADVAPAVLFAKDNTERTGILHALTEQGHLTKTQVSGNPAGYEVSSQGWARFDALSQGVSSKDNPAFVAMWYGNEEDSSKTEMDRLFREGIEPGVVAAGYKPPLRIDADKHDDYIMNKVLAAIRMAPFVVADYTGQRPGVYFEAGFARGLGIQVIHCCREDDFDKRHFDTQQLPHIRWREPVELKERLSDWILGTLGRGPVRSKS